jgi:hypothetical protein
MKNDFSFYGFNLPFDPTNDYAVDNILAPLNEQQIDYACNS